MLKVGDPVSIISEKNQTLLRGIITSYYDDIIRIGNFGYLFNCSTNTLTYKRNKKKRIRKNCFIIYSESTREELESLAFKDLMRDEIYWFFNGGSDVVRLPIDTFDKALDKLSIDQLEKLSSILVPFGMGTKKNLDELKIISKNEITNYIISYL